MRLKLVPQETNWDFFSRPKLWLGISVVLIVLAFVSFGLRGLLIRDMNALPKPERHSEAGDSSQPAEHQAQPVSGVGLAVHHGG